MRIAFYAPLKPPGHPVPSGDRRMARLLIDALRHGGHEVALAAVFRSWEGAGDGARQDRLRHLGERLAARLVRRYRASPPATRPDLWFTYHLYYKAPDWLGPAVADALAIPYAVAEASHAPKRAAGAWATGHRATVDAVRAAAAVFAFNRDDLICLPEIVPATRLHYLPPFLDAGPFAAAATARDTHRAALADRYGLDPARPWLLAVAMMRPGDKLASYKLLATALDRLTDRPWQLLIAGDGPARDTVRGLFAAFGGGRVRFADAVPAADLPALYAAADLFVWPAVGEAFGMAILEAQAAGLPVVAGDLRGVPDIVGPDSGILTSPGDDAAFAEAVGVLLGDGDRRRRLSRAARQRVAADHDIAGAAAVLDRHLRGLTRAVA
jgi:glycosyltransferase involved in cell wall biosynthesis